MDPFVAEIRIFPFNFAPKGWAGATGNPAPLAEHGSVFAARHHLRRRRQVQLRPARICRGCAPMHPARARASRSTTSVRPAARRPLSSDLESEIPSHQHILAVHPRETVLIVCAGSANNFNFEDFCGAGAFVERFAERLGPAADLSDAARAALALYRASPLPRRCSNAV